MKLEMKFGSHIPVLVKLLSMTRGNVLEMGMGYFSTPVLHWLCQSQNRLLVSYENNPSYYSPFDTICHQTYLIDDWDKAEIEKYWAVALIDHAPSERRKIDIVRLAYHAKYIVIHDTYWKQDKHYQYKEIWKYFKYRWDYNVHCQTTVVSNFYEIKDLI